MERGGVTTIKWHVRPADVSSNQERQRLDESNSCDGLRFPSFDCRGEIGRDHGSHTRGSRDGLSITTEELGIPHAPFSQLTRVSRDG